jgi:NADH:ubiquinone oxidoreductase subunit H
MKYVLLSPVQILSEIFPILRRIKRNIVISLHRTPFDFAEGESELVSGFSVEYGGGGWGGGCFNFLG